MERDPRFQLTDAPCDFEEAILNGIDLCVYPPCAFQSYLRQCLYQDIGGTMEKETELIGRKAVTGCAV